MLSNEMDILKEVKDAISEPELKEIAEFLKRLCGRKKRNFTTGPVIKPVRFDNNSLKQQTPRNFVVVKALNNTSELQRATVRFYDLGIFTKDKVCKNQAGGLEKVLIFSQTENMKYKF